jgi:tetratricopeptide (TPR) repeat protein
MAANSPTNSASEQDWQKRESPGKALIQIGIAALLLGGGVGLYYKRTQTRKQVYELNKTGREQMLRDNPKDLLAAREKFGQSLALDSNDAFAVSSTALVNVELWSTYGVAGEKAAADEFVAKAESINAPIEEHFAAVALYKLKNGEVEPAATYLEGILKKGGAAGGVTNAMGLTRRAQGKLDEARAYLKKGSESGWRNPRFSDDLADSYFGDGDFINAQSIFAKVVEVANSEHLRSRIGLDRARIARGIELKKASDDLDEVLGKPAGELTPTLSAMALTARAEQRRFEQKADEAAKFADQAIAADPSYPWAYAVKGSLLAQKGPAGVSEAYDKAIALDPHVGFFYFDAARSLAHAKAGPKAESFMAAYAKAIKVDDRYHLTYGELMRELGNLDKAQSEYGEALKLNGLNAHAHYALGEVLLAKTQLPQAQGEFEKALAAQHNYPDAQVELGNIKFQQKSYEDALQEFAKALIQMKTANVDRAQMNGLLDDVNGRLIKANQKNLAKAWVEQGKQLVR